MGCEFMWRIGIVGEHSYILYFLLPHRRPLMWALTDVEVPLSLFQTPLHPQEHKRPPPVTEAYQVGPALCLPKLPLRSRIHPR